MPVLGLREVSLSFGGPLLLDQVNLQLEIGERVCLLGRNGTGKSTLMKIMAGLQQPDSGEVARKQGLSVARLFQELPTDLQGTVYNLLLAGCGTLGNIIDEYRRISESAAGDSNSEHKRRALKVQIDSGGGWQLYRRVEEIVSRLQLDPQAEVATLSAGLQRRCLLAKALLDNPELLLLDEPTNHLDLATIQWLENFLKRFSGCVVFVTHDRAFLQQLATRIVELDRGRLFNWNCDYATYLKRKQEQLEVEEKAQQEFDRKLAQEEVWIRKGVRERRKRNEGRVRALLQMRKERAQRREKTGLVNLQIGEAERSGQLVIKAEQLSFKYEKTPIVKQFSTTIMRGDKVGIVGPNGCGKSTLLKLLLGELQPAGGSVRQGTNLQVAYFDQRHAQLDEQKNVMENVAFGNESVTIDGRSQHVMGYLQNFLFDSLRARSPVWTLSGGERNRLLLARLFTRPSNLLVLDEPTNDLDLETLEILEEMVAQYQGTVLLVSHDRAFLNNVVTGTIAWEGEGVFKEYVGGYDDWLRQRKVEEAGFEPKKPGEAAPVPEREKPRKLGYKEQRELEALPERIEQLEIAIAGWHEKMNVPGFFRSGAEEVTKAQSTLKQLETELNEAYTRWETLEEKQAQT